MILGGGKFRKKIDAAKFLFWLKKEV